MSGRIICATITNKEQGMLKCQSQCDCHKANRCFIRYHLVEENQQKIWESEFISTAIYWKRQKF